MKEYYRVIMPGNKVSDGSAGAGHRRLGLADVFSIAAGAMISSGLFVLPGIAFGLTGPSLVLAYVLAAVLYVPAICSQLELATAMPKSGGSYFFVERSLGGFAGTLSGLINWMAISLKSAFALVGLGTLGLLLFPGTGVLTMKLTAVAAGLLFWALNVFSVKGAGRLQQWLVAGLLLSLGAYVLLGISKVQPARFAPFATAGVHGFLAVTGMVFVSYAGLTKVVDLAGEIDRPQRNLPLGMFLAFGVVNVLYVLTVFVTIGVLDADRLRESLTPIVDGAGASVGLVGVLLMSVAAFLAYATTGNAGILAASRSPLAMSRDGLLPEALSRTSRRFGTPHVALAATCVTVILIVCFLSVESLAKTASAMLLLSFVLANVAVVVMRQSHIQGYRPTFRAPLYPYLQIAAVLIYGALLALMGRVSLIGVGLFILAASVWYATYVRWRIDRESAVVYMVKRILAAHLRRTGLEDELLHISLERDNIELDRFDRLVKEGPILDIEERVDAKELFRRLAATLSPRLNLPEDELYRLLLDREGEGSTVIHPGLAIPHVILPGEGVFAVTLVRCREGAIFSDLHPPVHAAFVLMGTADERHFHLKALVAIAHIVQEEGFDARWREAPNREQLRDVVLLSGRKRMVLPLSGDAP